MAKSRRKPGVGIIKTTWTNTEKYQDEVREAPFCLTPHLSKPRTQIGLVKAESGAIREAVMGQVGDSFDLSWLVFDLTQQGAAMTKLYSEHGKKCIH